MEPIVTGPVLTEATIENLMDLWDVERGLRRPNEARRITVSDAQVSPRVTLLTLPTWLIQQLGLERTGSRRVTSSAGLTEASTYEVVRLTIQGRSCTMDVIEAPDSVPILIGHLTLTHLDLVVDPHNHCLIGNPAHGGEHVYELYSLGR